MPGHRCRAWLNVDVNRADYPTRKLRLQDEGTDAEYASLTPAQRVEMVWPLTVQAWTFLRGDFGEPRLRRDAVRTVRGRR